MCRDGTNPYLISKVSSGRETYLYEVSVIGDALLACTDAYRINYEILGNSEAALHAHVFPRYSSETTELRKLPAWFYDWDAAPKFDPKVDGALVSEIANYLKLKGISQT